MAAVNLAALAVDAALVVIVVESVFVVMRRHRAAFGKPIAAVLANLAAGLCLMLALRAAVAGAGWPWIVAGLALSGVAHVGDWILGQRRHADVAP